jgi:uncharacterized protein (TIGR00297 family)
MSVNPRPWSDAWSRLFNFRRPPRERYDGAVTRNSLAWQSKLILLLVLPVVGCGIVLETSDWLTSAPSIVYWALGLSAALGVFTLAVRAATPFAAITGAAITTQLMFATVTLPFHAWRTDLVPVLAVSLLAFASTRMGRAMKEKLGTAEARHGRSAAQVAANLGVAALVSTSFFANWAVSSRGLSRSSTALLAATLAALAEAAADTVSSEIGQVLGGRPRLITTLAPVDPGTDGGITFAGSIAGIAAAAIVAALGSLAVHPDLRFFAVSIAGAVFGLFFDSLLGATLERIGWLNNDAVNFLSTVSAVVYALWLANRFPVFSW